MCNNVLCWAYLIMTESWICLWNHWFPGLKSLWGGWQEKHWLWTKVMHIHPLHSQQAAFQVISFMQETILPAQQRSWLGFRQLYGYQQLGSQWLHFKPRNQFTKGKGLVLQFLQTTELSCSIHHWHQVVSAAHEYFCGSKFKSERNGTGTWLFILERLNGLWEFVFLFFPGPLAGL